MRTLIAAKCPGITLNSMHGFPELRHLDLTGCEGIAPGTAVSAYLTALHTTSSYSALWLAQTLLSTCTNGTACGITQ